MAHISEGPLLPGFFKRTLLPIIVVYWELIIPFWHNGRVVPPPKGFLKKLTPI